MSLPEILRRAEEHEKSLLSLQDKLESVIQLICGNWPRGELEPSKLAHNPDGFMEELGSLQARQQNWLNELHYRLDEFRDRLAGGAVNQSSLAEAIAKDLRSGSFVGKSPKEAETVNAYR